MNEPTNHLFDTDVFGNSVLTVIPYTPRRAVKRRDALGISGSFVDQPS